MNVQLILIHAALLAFLFPPGITEKPAADTLKIKTAGAGNQIRIDSAWFSHPAVDTVITAGATGEIKQTGKNNQVEINTAGQNPNDQCPMTSAPSSELPSDQCRMTSDSSTDQCPVTSDKKAVSPRQHIKVTQTGKNNTVKINQR